MTGLDHMTEYGRWLSQQTSERRDESLEQIKRCKRLGELDRTTPSCDEAKQLREQITAYYAKWK